MSSAISIGYMHGPKDLRFTTTPPVDLSEGQIRLIPLVGGICGSDLPYFTRAEDFDGNPPVLGSPLHEIVGIVEESQAPSISPGEMVVGWAPDNNALASQVVTTAADVTIVEELHPTEAIIAQPLACVFAAMQRLHTPLDGVHVAVLGLGPIGLLFTHVAHTMGAWVTGVDPVARYEKVERFGVDHVVHHTAETWAQGVTNQPQVVIEVVGHQFSTLNAATQAVRPWGEIFYFGVPETTPYKISMAQMLRKQLTLKSGTTALDRPFYLAKALEYLHTYPGLADSLVTHTVPFKREHDAFALASAPASGVGKVLIKFPALADHSLEAP